MARMPNTKVSFTVDAAQLSALQALAAETNQSISRVLNEAIAEYLLRRGARPIVFDALDRSIEENRRLGELLAR